MKWLALLSIASCLTGCSTATARGVRTAKPDYSIIAVTGRVTKLPKKNAWPSDVSVNSKATLWMILDNRQPDTRAGDPASGVYHFRNPPCRWRLQVAGTVLASEDDPRGSFTVSTRLPKGTDTLSGYSFGAGYITTAPAVPKLRSLLVTGSLLKFGGGLLTSDELPLRELPLSAFDAKRSLTVYATATANGTPQNLVMSIDSFKVFQASRESL